MPNNWVSYGTLNAVSTGQRASSVGYSAVGQSETSKRLTKDWTGPDMKMSKVGNQTNSQDPQAVNSRVFVGNLNTYYCTKTDVERMFQRYGRLAGISMHKGYAFVQYTNPFDARGACLGEDGRTILGQTLDVNMVSEPKPHQTGRKRQNVAKTGNDWDYYYDSYYRSRNTFAGMNRGGVPPLKRPRLLQSARPGQAVVQAAPQPVHFTKPKTVAAPSLDQIKTYSNPDILICGNCREMFSELHELLEHKKEFCKLRFTCKCNLMNGHSKEQCYIADLEETSTMLLCVQCKEGFHNAWDLMVHVQDAHMVNIYEMGPRRDNQNKNNDHDDEDSNHPDQDSEAQLKVNLMEATVDSPEAQQNGISQHLEMGGRTNGLEEIAAD